MCRPAEWRPVSIRDNQLCVAPQSGDPSASGIVSGVAPQSGDPSASGIVNGVVSGVSPRRVATRQHQG